MPQCNDSVIVSAARDGQVMCHVISTTGEPITSKQVGLHRDSAHKVGVVTVIMTSLVDLIRVDCFRTRQPSRVPQLW